MARQRSMSNCAPDVCERSPAATVQDERDFRQCVGDSLAARNVELRLGLVVTVRGADRHRKRIDARRLRKRNRFVNIGERRFVALRDMADFAFACGAERLRVIGAETRQLDVFVKRQPRSVEHDGRVAPREGVFHLLHVCAVVEMDGDGLRATMGQPQDHSGEIVRLVRREQTLEHLDDDRRLLRFGRLDDGRRAFVVRDIERPDGAVFTPRLAKHFLHGGQWHVSVLLGVTAAKPQAPQASRR